jgi:hypothetical protein
MINDEIHVITVKDIEEMLDSLMKDYGMNTVCFRFYD